MPIGLSNGNYYRDEMHYLSSQWDDRYDDNVVTPNKMQTDKQLDNSETDPSTGIGLPVSYKLDDKRDQSFVDMLKGYVGEQLTSEKMQAILQHPMAPTQQTITANQDVQPTKLGNDLGLKDLEYKPDASKIDASRLTDIHRGGPPVPMPEVIAKTKAGDITNEDVDTAINVGMGGGPGTIAGLNSLGSLAAESRGALLSNLGHAQVLENGGVHPDDIFTTTGFFKGTDGKWRHEIGDAAANFKENWADRPSWSKVSTSSTLGNILDHPELYKHYPELKDMAVHYDKGYSGAHYNPNDKEIVLGGAPYKNLLGEDVVAARDKSTLMHEVQHAVQDIEGFAPGGTPSRAGIQLGTNPPTYVLKHQEAYKNWMDDNMPKLNKIYDKFEKAGKDRDALTDKEIALVQKYQTMKETFQKYRQEGDIEASSNYFKIAGEVEARNVQNRMDLDEITRKSTPPRWTQDIPDNQQIVKDEPSMGTPYGAFTVRDLMDLSAKK